MLSPHIWRNMRIHMLRKGGIQARFIAKLFGISPSRVSQILERDGRAQRVANSRLMEFKAGHCADEIRLIKRQYDALDERNKLLRKADMARNIDQLLKHLREARDA